jgi:neutral amino acid transport system substrate-binding protein
MGFLAAACQLSEDVLISINGDNDASLDQEELLEDEALDESFSEEDLTIEPAAGGLKIGAVMSYTGEFARTGQPMIEALPLLVDQVNACGGVNGQSVSLVVEDDQSQPERAASALDKLIRIDQVDVAIVGFVSSAAPEVLDIAVQNQIPIVSPGTTSPVFTEWAREGRFDRFWARTAPSDTHRAAALARMAIDRRYRNISLVVADNEDGIQFEQAFIGHFEKLGGTVLNKENPNRYDLEGEFFTTPALNAFYPSGGTPDAVIAAVDLRAGPQLLRTAYDLGATGGTPIILANSFQPRTLLERVGVTFDGRYVLANICTGLRLVSAQDIDFQGASGSVNLDENGDVVGNYDVWSVNDQGKIEVIHQIRLER